MWVVVHSSCDGPYTEIITSDEEMVKLCQIKLMDFHRSVIMDYLSEQRKITKGIGRDDFSQPQLLEVVRIMYEGKTIRELISHVLSAGTQLKESQREYVEDIIYGDNLVSYSNN